MWLNTFISAVIGIITFVLAFYPKNSLYYAVPMDIIGRVYANSMLVLINSRMILGSEETMVISVLRFGTDRTAPATLVDSIIEADNGDAAVDTRAWSGPSESSEPGAV